ncbi:enoyl-CoA hydratase-related protein [Ideonella sp.]|uniref:enoyl-CoA hydratase-related protein n=1 Tax=Ideonella sp. TaxID=1929293 RepID=UPI0035B18BA8
MSDVLIERDGGVVVARLNRPQALNALNTDLMHELVDGLRPFDRDRTVGCFVITGSDQVFAAGADIKEMRGQSYMDMFYADFFAGWDAFTALRTPKIAAVAGHALGGGCELAMMCDLIFAADNAQFGQPEIKLGVIPGMGGSQRLTKLVGKSVAMDMVLTGRTIGADEAQRVGLVSRVVPVGRLMDETLGAARQIAGHGKAAAMVAREAVERALELGLREGLLFERRTFHALFATEDQKEGMQAFVDKRPALFQGR